jgi:SAM-dependent methyltransferase
MDFRNWLEAPALYHAFQRAGGFFQARVKAIRQYAPIERGDRVLDIGCGPGHIVEYLPNGISYFGFDIDSDYITYAQNNFGQEGAFACRHFDADASREFGPANVVMMNGVLHHLSDEEVLNSLSTIRDCLKPDGFLFTLDGCFRDGQHRLARWLLEHDRGKFVRTEAAYRSLLLKIFPKVKTYIREDISWCPHTFIINIAGR